MRVHRVQAMATFLVTVLTAGLMAQASAVGAQPISAAQKAGAVTAGSGQLGTSIRGDIRSGVTVTKARMSRSGTSVSATVRWDQTLATSRGSDRYSVRLVAIRSGMPTALASRVTRSAPTKQTVRFSLSERRAAIARASSRVVLSASQQWARNSSSLFAKNYVAVAQVSKSQRSATGRGTSGRCGATLLRAAANASNCDFTGGDLSRSSLPRINLQDSNLTGLLLRSASLRGANLSGSNVTGAVVSGAQLAGANTADSRGVAVGTPASGPTPGSPQPEPTPTPPNTTTPGQPATPTSTGVSDGTVTLTWSAPGSDGGVAITGYNVTVSTNSSTGFSDASGCTNLGVVLTCTAAGLTNGTPYYFKVAAVNAQGVGESSSAGGPFTPLTTPDALTAVSATAGDLDAAVSWTAPQSDGGSPLVSYTATAVADGQTTRSCTSNSGMPITPSCTITNLINDVTYSVSVVATNSVGASQPSTPTSVTPAAPCADGGPCAVGDVGPGGGTVFYVAPTPQTWGSYLEAAPKTWAGIDDPVYDWGAGSCESSGGGVTQTAIGTGKSNTTTVMAACSSGQNSPAASAAFAYAGGGASDWFLPSKDELAAMVAQRESLELAEDLYWSSSNSADQGDDAYAQEAWGSGSAYLDLKDQAWMVRPIRQFGPTP